MYKTSKAYRVGWDKGLNVCRVSSYSGRAMPGASQSGPIPDQNPGNGGVPRGL